VKGEDQHALYKWLKEKTGKEPNWNFSKYLVKPDGSVTFYDARTNPLDKSIIDNI
jgi:glutathione peroxidase